jgi:hypothetical protein
LAGAKAAAEATRREKREAVFMVTIAFHKYFMIIELAAQYLVELQIAEYF